MKESEEEVDEVDEVEEEEWEDKKMYTGTYMYLTVYTSPTDVCV